MMFFVHPCDASEEKKPDDDFGEPVLKAVYSSSAKENPNRRGGSLTRQSILFGDCFAETAFDDDCAEEIDSEVDDARRE